MNHEGANQSLFHFLHSSDLTSNPAHFDTMLLVWFILGMIVKAFGDYYRSVLTKRWFGARQVDLMLIEVVTVLVLLVNAVMNEYGFVNELVIKNWTTPALVLVLGCRLGTHCLSQLDVLDLQAHPNRHMWD